MICAKCGQDYSNAVFPLHVSRCPGNVEKVEEKQESKIIEPAADRPKVAPRRRKK